VALRSGAWSRRLSEWRLAARLVDDVELAVKVIVKFAYRIDVIDVIDVDAVYALAQATGPLPDYDKCQAYIADVHSTFRSGS
jgi:hypothetical protein